MEQPGLAVIMPMFISECLLGGRFNPVDIATFEEAKPYLPILAQYDFCSVTSDGYVWLSSLCSIVMVAL